MEGAPWGPAGERAGGRPKPGGVGVQENREDRAAAAPRVTRSCGAVTQRWPPPFHLSPSPGHPEPLGGLPCWLPAPPPAQTHGHTASLLADALGAPVGLGADSRGLALRRSPCNPSPIPPACTIHPYIWPCVLSIWSFVRRLEAASGWAGAPRGSRPVGAPSPRGPAGPPPVMSFNKPSEGFFSMELSPGFPQSLAMR